MASVFDTVTDVFTGRPGKEAAEKQQAFIAQQQAANDARLRAAQEGGLADLQSGREGALGAVRPAFAQGRTDIGGATDQATGALYAGQIAGAGALGGGQADSLAALRSGVEGATGAYDPLRAAAGRYGDAASGASDASADALGLNGPEGIARAQAGFQAGPGFNFALNQGLESVLRNANASGMVAGGNALQEAQRFGQGLGQQEWDKHTAALRARESLYAPLERGALGDVGSGVSQAELAGGTGAANIYSGAAGRLADLYSTTGRAGADIYRGEGTSLADLASRGGLAESGIFTDSAQREAALRAQLAGYGSTFSAATLKPYGDSTETQANAELGGSKNLWNLGINTAKGVAGMPPGSTPNPFAWPSTM